MVNAKREVAGLDVRAAVEADDQQVIALWERCALLRPWNDPRADIALCRATPGSELLVASSGVGGSIIAAVMLGFDGHRGWLYYLAVDPRHRRQGHGVAMVRHAERRLRRGGATKVNLMIRAENAAVRDFYHAIGYLTEERVVMARRLDDEG